MVGDKWYTTIISRVSTQILWGYFHKLIPHWIHVYDDDHSICIMIFKHNVYYSLAEIINKFQFYWLITTINLQNYYKNFVMFDWDMKGNHAPFLINFYNKTA